MTCPKCSSEHTMSTTRTVSTLVRWMMGGKGYARTESEKQTVVHKCLDCGTEWEE